jgi:hypothetical protein
VQAEGYKKIARIAGNAKIEKQTAEGADQEMKFLNGTAEKIRNKAFRR